MCSRLTGYCFKQDFNKQIEEQEVHEEEEKIMAFEEHKRTCVDDFEEDCIKYCSDDNTCAEGEYCHYNEIMDVGSCLKNCQSDLDCSSDQKCTVDGMCQLKCTSDSQCDDGYICHSDGSCQYPCGNDLDCYESEYCDKAEKICVPKW